MSRGLKFFCWGVEARNLSTSQVFRGPSAQSRSCGCWLPDVEMRYIGWRAFVSTNRKTRAFNVEVRKSVRIQSVGSEGLVVASDVAAWRWCVAGTSHQGGDGSFCFNFTGQRRCVAPSEIYYNKLVSVLAQLTRDRNRAHLYAWYITVYPWL
jgi:hypothetical protein